MPLPNCETCAFWDHDDEDGQSGECRRYAPRALHERDEPNQPWRILARWPETYGIDGCGEHRPIPSNDDAIPYGRITS